MTRRQGGPLLLTGATGFVGMELLVRLLEQTDHDVIALVRASDDDAAQRRIEEVLEMLLPPAELPRRGRVRALAADLEAPALGLSAATRDRLTGSIAAVVHCAASVSFTLELEAARRINVNGTREILALAEEASRRGGLDRVVHVSTAYVAGERSGYASEQEGNVGQSFRNTYERTKLEAEQLVQDSGLPASILRPSVIVGDSVTGWTPSFNVIYWPLQAFVPIDTVADALLELVRGPVRAGAFHVVAGEDAVVNDTLATMAAEAFDTAPPRFVAPGVDPGAEKLAGALVPYFRVRCIFDALRGRGQLGATPPPLEDYFPALMHYAREASWGRRPAPRWGASELARVA